MDTLANDLWLFVLEHTLRKYPTAASGVNMLAGLLTSAARRQRSDQHQQQQQRDHRGEQCEEDQGLQRRYPHVHPKGAKLASFVSPAH